METLSNAAAVASLIWGVTNLLQVIIAKWDTPHWTRSMYSAGSLIAGVGCLAGVGFNNGLFSFVAAMGLLNHLSAAMVYVAWCLRSRQNIG